MEEACVLTFLSYLRETVFSFSDTFKIKFKGDVMIV